MPRSVFGSLRSAWRPEAQRLQRLNKSPWQLSNDVLNAWLMSVALWGVLIAVFGPTLIPFVLIQAVYGFSMLESVNYLTLRWWKSNARRRCRPERPEEERRSTR